MLFEDCRTAHHIEIACYSGIGARDSQQDAGFVYVDDARAFGTICDGMGGARGGGVASETAVEYVRKKFQDELAGRSDFVENGLQILEAADDILYTMKDRTGKRLGCGTTIIIAYLNHDYLYWASVGDSRIYLMRGMQMVQVTTDHNYYLRLNDLLRDGEISKEEYAKELPRGEALISFLGMGGLMLIDVNDRGVPLIQGDTILMCSDGVYRTIKDEELRAILGMSSLDAAARRIISLIEDRMSVRQDNFTFVLMRKRK